MELSVYDYIVFVIVLIISAGIGVYYRFTGGKQKTVQEYMLANGQMSAIPVAFSLMASFMSAVTLLGVSSENYMYGTQYMLVNFAYILATPIAAYVFLPVFYKLRATSVYEYLDLRFGRPTRIVASFAFTLQMVLYMGIVVYAPSLALSAVTGLNKVGAILAIGLVCTFYSTIGGMKAVLITDVFQSILMFVAVYCVVIKGSIDLNGFSNILSIADDGNRIEFFTLDLDPTARHTVWTQLIGGGFMYLSLYAVNQAQVQRLLTVRTLKNAQWALWLQLPILMVLSFSTAFAGLTIYAKYQKCDPILQGRITASDQLLPLFVADSMADLKGITGLFIAGLLAGSLSTVSSAINSLAAVTWEDYITPMLKTTPSGSTTSLANKILALCYGLSCVGIAFIAGNLKGVLQASLTVFGVVGGPLLGLFTLGMLFPFVSQRAAVPSFLISLAFGLWVGFGGPKPPNQRRPFEITECDAFPIIDGQSNIFNFNSNASFISSSSSTIPPVLEEPQYFYLYKISYMWYTLMTFLITVIIACLLSIIFRQKTKVPKNLLSPVIHKYMGYHNEIDDQDDSHSNNHDDKSSNLNFQPSLFGKVNDNYCPPPSA